ncbi:MAG: hypothetical protein MJZ86_03620 [Bacteroidales bacterium]|nr:hypothetical protein [Bacteroidales bacterium]
MKKSAKLFVSLLFVVGLMLMSSVVVSCGSSTTTMNPNPKYKTSKPIKDNYKIRGTNKKNGSTYHSY